jgi:hypothetical protein
MSVAVWVYFWVLYSILLVCVSVFVPVLCCLCYYGSVVEFEIRCSNTSNIDLFAQDSFGYSGSFMCSYEFLD